MASWRAAIRSGAAAVLLLAASEGRPGEPEEPAPPPIAPVSVDPEGSATRSVAEARDAIAGKAWPRAFDLLAEVIERHPHDLVAWRDADLPPRVGPAGRGRLTWREAWERLAKALERRRRAAEAGADDLFLPAGEVAEALLANLPAEQRAAIEERWGQQAAARWAQAERGSAGALEGLALRFAATASGRRALRLLAEVDLERGHFDGAVRKLERLLRVLPPETEGRVVGEAVLRLAHALTGRGDRGGLAALEERFPWVLDVRVASGGTERPLRDHLEECRRTVPGPGAAPPAAPAEEEARGPLVALWSRSFADEGLLEGADDFDPTPTPIEAGALLTEDLAVVHEGRVVRARDAWTGVERWRFPATGPRALEFPSSIPYAPHDRPARTIARAGDLLLAVMGSPPCAGTFEHRGGAFQVAERFREARARLVALDATTGELRWATGRADETHPVLGDPDTGCVSPPLVRGDAVYALFARLRGAAEIHLACLERASGAIRWVAFLGSGRSGRSSEEPSPRFHSRHASAVPWGARPSLAGDEVCAVPHAGFAAGVDAGTGSVRWVRALPRHSAALVPESVWGFSARNAPLAHRGLWIVGALDCPRLFALERGTGRARWWDDGTAPLAGSLDLHGVAVSPAGDEEIRLSGEFGCVRASVDGPAPGWLRWGERWPWLREGRGVDEGDRVSRVLAGRFCSARWAGDPEQDALAEPVHGPAPVEHDEADLHRGEEAANRGLWLAVGRDRVTAYAREPDVERRVREGGPPELAEALRTDGSALASRLRRAVSSGDRRALDSAVLRATAWLDGAPDFPEPGSGREPSSLAAGVAALAEAALALPPGPRGELCLRVARLLERTGNAPLWVSFLDRWIAAPPGEGDAGLVEWGADSPFEDLPGSGRLREDLAARHLLERARRFLGAEDETLARRDEARAAAVREAADAGEAPLREAIRRAAGTAAEGEGLRALAERLAADGRFAAASRALADSRLSGGPSREQAARDMVQEAAWLAEAGDVAEPRDLLECLLPWAPPGTADRAGRTPLEISRDLRRRHAWWPGLNRRLLDVWPQGRPVSATDRMSVTFLGLEGPGAPRERDEVVLSRGLALEVWSLSTGERLAELGARDGGWLGARLRDAEEWLPEHGVLISAVPARQPADETGIRPGDWILEWDGAPLAGVADLMGKVARSSPGREIGVRILRRGRPVAERLVPGERPDDQAAPLGRARVWAAEDGTLVVPARTGLLRVDAARRTDDWLWRWEGTGTVRRALVRGGVAYVWVGRSMEYDTVVAVDLASGGETWRRDLRGAVEEIVPTGSALVVETSGVDRLHVLDREDGRTRVEMRLPVRNRRSRPRTHVPARAWAVAAGRLWILDETRVQVVNTTTGDASWWSDSYHSEGGVDASLSAGAFTALIAGRNDVVVYAADPLSDAPPLRLPVDPNRTLQADQDHRGEVDENARVLVGGRALFLVRNSGGDAAWRADAGIDVFVVHLRWEGLTAPTTGGAPPGVIRFTAVRMLTKSPVGATHLFEAEASPDGILLTGGQFSERPGEDRREVMWVSSYLDPDEEVRSPAGPWETGGAILRQGPARVGRDVLLPTDEGALLLPAESPVR